MCPSSGHGGGRWVRWKRALRAWRSQEVKPVVLFVPAALLLLLVFYCFPVLSSVLLCAAGAWLYYSSGQPVWRYLDWRQVIGGGAPGRRQRPAGHRRQREQRLKWTPSSLLLLMGSYLGKQEPPARAVGRGSRELKEMLARPNPAVPTPTRRLSFRETPGIFSRAYLSPRRRYPIHQPQYSMPGSLPTVYFDGYQKKCLLSPKSSLVRSPVTVKIARPDPNIARSPVLDNLLSPGPASPLVQCAPDPCAKETVLNAIRESRKRMNKDDAHSAHSGGLENKRRRQVSNGSRNSSFEYPLPNGTLPSCISKPDSLKRGFNAQVLEESVNKRSRTSSISSMSTSAMNGITMSSHNAITSSYSSSKAILQKRKMPQNASAVSSSPSSRSHTPDLSAKKAREESHEFSPITVQQDKDQTAGLSATPPSKSSSINTSSENGSGGARRKKVLLVYSRRSDQYPLPPPPLVGYSVTSKDFDSEKKAALQRLNKALEDAAGSVPLISAPSTAVTTTLTSSSVFNPPTTSAAASLTLPTSSASSNPLLLSLAKMQNKEEAQVPAQTVNTNTSNDKVPTSSNTAIFSVGNPLKEPVPSAPAVTKTLNSAPPLPSDTAQPKSEPPKSSLLQILTKPLENDSVSGFKPIFPTSVTTAPLTMPSTVQSATSSNSATSVNTFKPIFGEQNSQPALTSTTFKPVFGDSTGQPPATSSSFTFQANSTSSPASSLFSGFGAKSITKTISTESASKSLAPPNSSSSGTTNTFTSSVFSSVATSVSGSNPAPVNSFPASNVPSDSQAKQFVFGPAPTSQATSGLNMFNTQPVPTTAPQPQQPPLFGSNTSAFTAKINLNAPAFPTNSGTSAFNSTSGSGIQAEKPAQNSVGFGASGTQSSFGASTQPAFGNASQPTFGANSHPAFGGNTTFAFGNSTPAASKVTFGNMNNTQTNSTPATNLFGSKPFAFGENSNSVPAFGTQSAAPAQTLGFGNSLAQNSSVITNPSTPLNFGTPAPAENKLAFGSQFGQNSPVGPLQFATSTPSFAAPGSFGQGTPGSFSIGVISKSSGTRQRVMARRQHQRKK